MRGGKERGEGGEGRERVKRGCGIHDRGEGERMRGAESSMKDLHQ